MESPNKNAKDLFSLEPPRKKKESEHPLHVHDENEPWVVSYADMMTLLFCFFVIMTSFATFDPITMAKKSEAVANYMSGGKFTEEEEKFKKMGEEIKQNADLRKFTQPKVEEGNIEVLFSTTVLFPFGGLEIKDEFIKNLDILIGIIKNRDPDYRIVIEGHTDPSDENIVVEGEKKSHWWLSSSRAALVVDRFLSKGFNQNQLVAVGYGDARPVAPVVDKDGNKIEENQALNRRVVIKVLKPEKKNSFKNVDVINYFENKQ